MPGSYSYTDLADRIEAVLGVRPALSTLRAAAAKDRRTHGLRPRHDRLTAGMPPARETGPRGRAGFDADQVEQWLADHPRLLKQHARIAAQTALSRGDQEIDVVREARASGLPWLQIAELLTGHDGKPRTRQGLIKRYQALLNDLAGP